MKSNTRQILLLTSLLVLSYIYWSNSYYSNSIKDNNFSVFNRPSNYIYEISHSKHIARPPKTSLSYAQAISNSNIERQRLAHAYIKASSQQQRNQLIQQARQPYIDAITTLLPYWYGTPWDFNGTSNLPQQGSIACGYYVTTVLRDTGLNIERNKLAQQAAENIIKSLVLESHIKRYSNIALPEFIEAIDTWGAGLYIVGLDFHVGYIWHDGQDIHFIHSSVRGPRSAFQEPAALSDTLGDSKYRVLGKISEDDDLIIKWLQQTPIITKS